MSFTCYFCGQHQGSGIKPKKITTKTRLIITKIVERVVAEKEDFNKKLSTVWSEGREEIVEEKIACLECAQKGFNPEVVEVIFEPRVVEMEDESEAQSVKNEAKI